MKEKRAFSIVKLGGTMQHAPIEMWVTADQVGIRMELDDFLRALAFKVGNPAAIITRAQLQAKLEAAADAIVKEMKTETIKVARP